MTETNLSSTFTKLKNFFSEQSGPHAYQAEREAGKSRFQSVISAVAEFATPALWNRKNSAENDPLMSAIMDKTTAFTFDEFSWIPALVIMFIKTELNDAFPDPNMIPNTLLLGLVAKAGVNTLMTGLRRKLFEFKKELTVDEVKAKLGWQEGDEEIYGWAYAVNYWTEAEWAAYREEYQQQRKLRLEGKSTESQE